MANVLLCWELGGGAGHCVRLAPIAAGLIAKGHHVSMASRNLITAREVFGSLPVKYFQSPFLTGPPSKPVLEPRSFVHILHNTGFGDAGSLEVLCAAWRNIFDSVQPHVIICDHSPMALLASRSRAVRRVIVGSGFFIPPAVSPFPAFRYWRQPENANEELCQDEDAMLRRVNEVLAKDHSRPLENLAGLYANVDAIFLLTFRELDHYPNRPGVEHLGMWFPETGDEPIWPAGDKPKLFVYLKPPAPNWRLGNLLAFICESRLAALLYVPGADAAWINRFRSPHVQIVARPLDMASVAAECDVAILNGNAGSVTALLLAGIPQLNIPLHLEQAILSRRVADLGAGLCAEPNRPEQMAARLMMLIHNEKFRQAAQAFATRYANYDPRNARERVVAEIDTLLKPDKLP